MLHKKVLTPYEERLSEKAFESAKALSKKELEAGRINSKKMLKAQEEIDKYVKRLVT